MEDTDGVREEAGYKVEVCDLYHAAMILLLLELGAEAFKPGNKLKRSPFIRLFYFLRVVDRIVASL